MFYFIKNIKADYSEKQISYTLFCLVFLLGIFSNSVNAQDYQLVWSDEFDGTELDLTKWTPMIGTGCDQGVCGWGNNELEYYRAENAKVADGFLTITAKKETYQSSNYTSARIRTINKGDWKYGKLEFRAKMPFGKGIWPAIWMMPTDNVYGGWAASGEIDIMEYLGHETNKVYGTLHYGGSWPNNKNSGKSYTLPNGTFSDDFHVFTLLWKEGQIQWLVDGVVFQTQTSWSSNGGSFPAPFDQKFHIILNLAVGGNWPGNPDATTQFPQEYVIDYARVYQESTTAVENSNTETLQDFKLDQNYPNPFNAQTIITYQISKLEHVELQVFDMLGRPVATLVNKVQGPGSYSVSLDASNLSSGCYMYWLKAGDKYSSKKLLLIK